jgi:hypothetical protein
MGPTASFDGSRPAPAAFHAFFIWVRCGISDQLQPPDFLLNYEPIDPSLF